MTSNFFIFEADIISVHSIMSEDIWYHGILGTIPFVHIVSLGITMKLYNL